MGQRFGVKNRFPAPVGSAHTNIKGKANPSWKTGATTRSTEGCTCLIARPDLVIPVIPVTPLFPRYSRER